MKLDESMRLYNAIKQNNIKNMFFTIKILSLFFAAAPLFQYFFGSLEQSPQAINYEYSMLIIVFALIIMCVVMFLWVMLDVNKQKLKHFYWIEVTIFFILFTASIYINGGNHSKYKFLFIILIVSYTIEYGKRVGSIIAVLASSTILSLDIIFSDKSVINTYFETDLSLSALFIVIAWTLGYYVKLERTHIEELTNFANVDGLTGIYNHRYFHEFLQKEFDESVNSSKDLSLIIADIDFFKTYNDIFGHRQGDELIKKMAHVFKSTVRPSDTVFRYGGDEFCVVMPNTDKTTAIEIGNNLRTAVESYKFDGMEHLTNKCLTISVGVASNCNCFRSYVDFIEKADAALYRAKYLRKNRVEFYDSVWDTFNNISDVALEEKIKYVKTLISVIDAKDKYTYFHIERVAHYCDLFADYLQMSGNEKKKLVLAAYLHDIGKINISKDLLISDKKLNKEEWEELKSHSTESANIISQIEAFKDLIPIVKHHHERYDGTGYPSNLKGNDIPVMARILAVADSFDAMTNKRPYQATRTFDEAYEELERCKETQFDPYFVDCFINFMKDK